MIPTDPASTTEPRPAHGGAASQGVGLDHGETDRLDSEVELLIAELPSLGGFVRESPEKLRRIVRHFRARLGQAEAAAPRCNAPWVSSVIEADGTVRPCFFHEPYGNIRRRPLAEVLNGETALEFRGSLDVSTNPVCRRCVCSLCLEPDNPRRSASERGARENR